MEIKVEKVMDKKKIAESLHDIIDVGVTLLHKNKLAPEDYGKMKVIRVLGSHINAAISMVQQETAMTRAAIVVERMKQLGYIPTKQLEK